jgi:PAS domain S-box-containing protein
MATEDIKRKRAEQIEAERALRESEVRFRELADNISQFAWTADRLGRRYWYNKRWYDYTGTTLEEMQGWGWKKVHHPEHVDRVVQRIRQSFESGEPWEDTFPLRSRDGNYRWFLSRALPIRNESGEVIRWFGTNTDVTEQIEAETALRDLNENLRERVEAETRERFRMWNVSEDLLVVADQEGKYISVNPAWTATLGWRNRIWWAIPHNGSCTQKIEKRPVPRLTTWPQVEEPFVLKTASVARTVRIAGYRGKLRRIGGEFTQQGGTSPSSRMPKAHYGPLSASLHRLLGAQHSRQ